jgi:hypothetical protein
LTSQGFYPAEVKSQETEAFIPCQVSLSDFLGIDLGIEFCRLRSTILHLRGNLSVRAMLREAAQDSLLCCSAITIGEIHTGMKDEERNKNGKTAEQLGCDQRGPKNCCLGRGLSPDDQEPSTGIG